MVQAGRPGRVAVVGGGPSGLMAAEAAHAAGAEVDVYERMGSFARKFLVAGKGGLNLTHSDPPARFVARYGARAVEVGAWLRRFDADALRAWAHGLGIETFVGSSGRVFPLDLKAAPLLRAWLRRLRGDGVRLHVRHDWRGWNAHGELAFATPDGALEVAADAVVLALGGGSWPVLGSDGRWTGMLEAHGIGLAPLRPSNCGFDVEWSAHFKAKHAGQPVRPVAAEWRDRGDRVQRRQGEFVVTEGGVEGSLVYALSADLRDAIAHGGPTTIHLDLAPARERERLERELAHPRGTRSLGEHLRRRAGIDGVRAGLLREYLPQQALADPVRTAAAIKALPLVLLRARPLEEAISSAGGVRFDALDDDLMLRRLPGIHCAGEMIDWEAPTGGYLLTACFAAGLVAGEAAARHAARTAGTRGSGCHPDTADHR